MASKPLCKFDGCSKPARNRGWCSAHYERWRRYGDPAYGDERQPRVCSVADCEQPHKGLGWCQRHLLRFKKYGDPLGARPKASDEPCKVAGCNQPTRALGLCKLHYQRRRNTGEIGPPEAMKTANGSALRFFEDVVLRHNSDECLIWPFAKSHGYGLVHYAGRGRVVSRLVCELLNGPPPSPDHVAAHNCGRGEEGCVSPRHVKWKSQKENIADQLTHGTRLRGSARWNAKLTEADVRQIRRMIGAKTNKQIARLFGVDPSVISHIKRRKCWGWLE